MEESELLKKRKEKIRLLQEEGIDPYPNDVPPRDYTDDLIDRYSHFEESEIAKDDRRYTLAGRIMAIRDFGKGAFFSLQDSRGKIQGYIRKDRLEEPVFLLWKKLDIGDIICIGGALFKTRTGELTIEVDHCKLLAKAVRQLPEKWHGLTDVETRYRQRHLDLIVNPEVKEVFFKRSRIISLIRQFMEERGYLEVETPMMQPQAGGAAAKPFTTYHNALGMELYLRIAPELYLKRLITGGLEKIFEINKNFRNEGISTFHNPEFTMMEFYCAYATYEDLMTFTEELIGAVCRGVSGSLTCDYLGTEIDYTPPWKRLTLKDAIVQYGGIERSKLEDGSLARAEAEKRDIGVPESASLGRILLTLFEELVEDRLIQPTFVTHYPVDVSPLSRKNARDQDFTDRFELYIYGKEIANAFSEINDPADQRERFIMQLREREAGDDEAHRMDEDYINVLEYGMPPTAGEGIGIDRLVMLFTNSPSIRDVILFPQLRRKD